MRNINGPPLGVVCLLVALAGCAGSGNPGGQSSAAPASSPSVRAVRVVALGDSDATGSGDPTGQGWVGRYAALVQATGLEMHVTNLASDGKTSDVLLTEVRSDPVTRQALRSAQVVLLGIGGADLNRGDEDLQAGRCKGRACYTPLLRQFGRNFGTTVAAVRQLAGRSTLIRAISLPNGYPGAGNAFPPFITPGIAPVPGGHRETIVCDAVRKYGGVCMTYTRLQRDVRDWRRLQGRADDQGPVLLPKCERPAAHGRAAIPSRPRAPGQLMGNGRCR